MLTVFKEDTPFSMKQRGEDNQILPLMQKIYIDGSDERTVEIMNAESSSESSTYQEVCCGKSSKATLIGVSLSFFALMTGIDIVMFYSNSLF